MTEAETIPANESNDTSGSGTTPTRSRKSKGAINMPRDVDKLDAIFRMLREDEALFNAMLGTVINAAALFATLAGLVLAIGLASLAFPIPDHTMLQHLQAYGFPGSGTISKDHWNLIVFALVSEFLLLLVTTGYFTWYPVLRVLSSQGRYSKRGIEYLLADVDGKQKLLQEVVNHSVSRATVVFLATGIVLPFLLLVLGAITSLYSVLLHIPVT